MLVDFAIVAPQKQIYAADLWDSPFSWRRSAGTTAACEPDPHQRLSRARRSGKVLAGSSRPEASVNSSLTMLLEVWPERDGTGDRAGSRKKKPTV
jgi:hypothetical protein